MWRKRNRSRAQFRIGTKRWPNGCLENYRPNTGFTRRIDSIVTESFWSCDDERRTIRSPFVTESESQPVRCCCGITLRQVGLPKFSETPNRPRVLAAIANVPFAAVKEF